MDQVDAPDTNRIPDESSPFTVARITPDTIDEANEMRLRSWLDTYINDGLGITREWIETRNERQMSDASRKRRLVNLKNPNSRSWIAKDERGHVIGMIAPYTDAAGSQQVGGLYVDKQWHGKGVSGALMQKLIDYFDPAKPIELTVATYNERAKAFYRKWGFQEVPGSEGLFEDKIPEVKMVRPAEAEVK